MLPPSDKAAEDKRYSMLYGVGGYCERRLIGESVGFGSINNFFGVVS